MSQRILLPAAVVLICSAASAYFLWKGAVSDESAVAGRPAAPRGAAVAANARDDKHRHDDASSSPGPLLEGWDMPAAAFVLSGEQHGYIEPCGCSLHQVGGLTRRADLMRQIKDRGWPLTAFDVGGLVNNPARKQAKRKLEMTLKCLKEMEYGAVALGREELLIGIDLLTYIETDRPPFLASNLVLFGSPDVVNQAYRVVTVGKVKVGVTAVFGESMKGLDLIRPAEAGMPPDIEFLDPVESLAKALAALEAEKPDLLVLLSHAKREETERLAGKFPTFDLIVSAGGPEDPASEPKFIGRTLLFMPGQKGKNVGVVGYYPQSKDRRLRFELVALDEYRFQETPAIQDQMRHYQEMLQLQNLVAGEPAIESPWNAPLKEPNEYVGAKVCGECHKQAYDKWLKTGHAKATESIKQGRLGESGRPNAAYISRIYDPECVNCHVTGWSPDPKLVVRYKSGYESEQATPHLLGQQCENCHGPGGRHADLERRFANDASLKEAVEKFRELAYVTFDKVGERLCVKCHDGDNDPHFKTDGDVFEENWNKIKHPWRD